MSRTPYATPEQYEAWSGLVAPLNAERLLTRASELLDATATAPFIVSDTTGLPEDVDEAAALRDATCAQVRFWVETGEEHDIDGLAGSAVSVGGVTGRRPPVIAPQALRLLRMAMLA
jgi:hypothetical protein